MLYLDQIVVKAAETDLMRVFEFMQVGLYPAVSSEIVRFLSQYVVTGLVYCQYIIRKEDAGVVYVPGVVSGNAVALLGYINGEVHEYLSFDPREDAARVLRLFLREYVRLLAPVDIDPVGLAAGDTFTAADAEVCVNKSFAAVLGYGRYRA